METELCKIAYKYGTDKCPKLAEDNNGGHTYTPVYYDFLKDKGDVKKVLEIGIGSRESMNWNPEHHQVGASLKMWRDFFPEAHIYGVDIDETAIFQDDRITTYKLDSTRGGDISWLFKQTGTDFDVVIDDGSHRTYDQLRTFRLIFPHLKKDALYFIEDSKHPEGIIEKLSEYDCLLYAPYPKTQNNLIIIRKR
ncbi:MAG: hypothetical protein AAB875_07320 [Patescibacteria group bacterium]